MNRVLQNTPNVIYVEMYVGETLTDADGTVTVTVKNALGVTIATGNATNEPSSVGLYSFALPAQSQVSLLTVTWAGTFGGNAGSVIQEYQVVGKFLFSLADLRAMDGLDNVTEFPTTKLISVRDEVNDLFIGYCHTAWGNTYRRQTIDTIYSDRVFTDRGPLTEVISVTCNGSAVTPSGFDRAGEIRGSFVPGFQNTVVEYVYGHETLDRFVSRAGLRLALYWLLNNESSIPDRARMLTTEWGTWQLTNATEDFITGLPEVDAILNRFNERVPTIA